MLPSSYLNESEDSLEKRLVLVTCWVEADGGEELLYHYMAVAQGNSCHQDYMVEIHSLERMFLLFLFHMLSIGSYISYRFFMLLDCWLHVMAEEQNGTSGCSSALKFVL